MGVFYLAKYGIFIDTSLNWKEQCFNTYKKASFILFFLERNFYKCPMKVRENCDNSLVRPILDYSCTVWNPYRKYQIERLALINTIHASSHICRFSLSFPFPQRYPFWNSILNSIRYFDSLDCFKTALESITLDTPFRQ